MMSLLRLRRRESEGVTNPPLVLSEKTGVRLPLVWLLGIISATASAVIVFQNLKAADADAFSTLAKEDERITKLEKEQVQYFTMKEDVAVMKNDVSWIRRALERQDRADVLHNNSPRPGSD